MDIHAPLEPIHSWRDIALHLGIVTIGLFIALSLEGLVEHIHNRHLVHEARANIRQELEDNHQAAQQDLVSLQKNIDQTQTNIETLRKMRADPKGHGSLINLMEFNPLDDAAWTTARDTGALSFMPYAEVQRYSGLYALEAVVNAQAIDIGHREFLALAPTKMEQDMAHLPAEEFTNMLRANASSQIELYVLKQYVQQLDAQYVAELKK